MCVLFAALVFVPVAGAAVYTFETQYEYDTADYAWLTDLVIKEDMQSLSGVAGRVTLQASSDYPYTETAQSFKNEVEKYCSLYTLDRSALKASYLYFVELLGSGSSVFASQVSDDQVRTYLESVGISYPSGSDAGTDVLAKALYVSLITGAFSDSELNAGMALEQALTSFVINISGFSEQELKKWVPVDGKLDSLDSYVLAVSRLTLWSNGYDVTADTDEEEVYKLMAVMTIRNLGLSVGTDVGFTELQAKYTAAMLGKKYSVTVDPSKLSSAVSSGTAPFYILQLIGRKNGLTVREDAMSYEEAFEFVAQNTGVFDLEEDEFYADVFDYDVYLSRSRDSLWLYPTSYYGGVSSSAVSISCAGQVLRDNYYTRVSIDPDAFVQTINISVAAIVDGNVNKNVYNITVHQEPGADTADDPSGDLSEEKISDILSSGTIISSILDSAGVSSSVSEAAAVVFVKASDTARNALALIAPTFVKTNDNASNEDEDKVETDPVKASPADASAFIGILDRLGTASDFAIDGIEGLSLGDKFAPGFFKFDFITFN